jgi:ADP-ribose pyrophosphatase
MSRLDRRTVFAGRVIDVHLDTLRFPDGSTGQREFVAHRGAAAIVPFVDDPAVADPRIVLLRQYRYAAGGELWEIPAGTRDTVDEPWQSCAARELEEETGYRAGHLEFVTRIYTAPGFCDEVIHIFAATELTPGQRNLDDDEFVEPIEVPLSEALAMVGDGRIIDGKTVAGLLHVSRFGRFVPGSVLR